jgi:chromosome segregation ATPase
MGLNEMFKKIASIESEKTELGKHKIDLATIDALKNEVIGYNKSLDSYNNDFKSMQSQLKDLSVKYGKLTDTYLSWFAAYNDTEEKATQLGIKLPNDIVKLEKDAISKSNEARDMGNKLYKFLQ